MHTKLQGVGTFGDLLDRIAKDYPDKSLKEVAAIIGISEKSYFNIKNGEIPKKKLIRSILSFVEKKYNADIELSGNKIKIKNLSVDRGSSSVVAGGNVMQEENTKLNYLLERIIQLEREKQELIEQLNGKRKK